MGLNANTHKARLPEDDHKKTENDIPEHWISKQHFSAQASTITQSSKRFVESADSYRHSRKTPRLLNEPACPEEWEVNC